MKVILEKFTKFFEIRYGWFFVNGKKQEWWNNRLQEKYFQQND